MKFSSFFLALVCIVFMSVSVSALSWNVCIDKQNPNAPRSLSVSGNVLLTWDVALDSPQSTNDCTFGIEHYNIYLNEVLIGTSSDLSYSGDALADGLYVFEVSAVDRAGNEGERAIKEVVFPLASSSNPPASSGGKGGSHHGGSGKSGSGTSPNNNGTSSSNYSNSGENGNSIGIIDNEEEEIGENGVFSMLTGAVVGVAGTTAGIVSGVFFILVILGFVAIKGRKKKS